MKKGIILTLSLILAAVLLTAGLNYRVNITTSAKHSILPVTTW